jgi:signal transduction histidine kinase
MFTRARLHLTLVYAALLGLTVVLVAGAIGYLAVQEARNTDDRELNIRATAVAAAVTANPPLPSGPPPGPQDGQGGQGGPGGPGGPGGRPGERGPHIEERGLLEYTMPVRDGQILLPPDQALPGLPDLTGARHALQSGSGSYTTVSIQGSPVRTYSLPVTRNGQVVAVVQVARSQYFVNASVTRLALIALAAGLVGVLLAGGAGYWLAGRTLRPIATALERQQNFAADASHELRTPLTVMLTNAELLTLHPERRLSEYQDVVADIIAEIERLSRLVSDLLTLARADQGKAVLALNTVDLAEVAGTVAEQFGPIAAGKGIELRTEIADGVLVTGDHDRLHQLAVILVDNAVRYTSSGSVTVRVSHAGNDGVLAVSDTGPGIAAEHLPHLFERFYRTDSARSAEEGGTGLGLALAEWIVHSHQGSIDVESTPGQGSTFTVHLPASRSQGRAQTAPRSPVAVTADADDA